MNAAMEPVAMDMTASVRTPARMVAEASGSLMRIRIWRGVLPMPTAASSSSGLMEVIPV